MAQKTKHVLKSFFKSQSIPTESNFEDLIDSTQSTLVEGSNIKITSGANGTNIISAEVPELTIPTVLDTTDTNFSYTGSGKPFYVVNVTDISISIDENYNYKDLPDGSVLLLINSGKTNIQSMIMVNDAQYVSNNNDYLTVVMVVILTNGSERTFRHQVIIGKRQN